MRRIFTRDHGRWPKGHIMDQPRRWWEQWFPGYEAFTRPTDEEPSPGRARKEVSRARN